MDAETYNEIVRILALGSFFVRGLGLLVLGIGSGWFALMTFRKGKDNWVQLISVCGFIALAAMLVRFQTAGAVGAYALGAGGSLLLWGLRNGKEEVEKVEE